MEKQTIKILNRLNADFYRMNSESFDRSRQKPWPGWERVINHTARTATDGTLHVLDVASGNMRFEKHLADCLDGIALHAVCIDSCDELATSVPGCDYLHRDVVRDLLNTESIDKAWGSLYDLVVSFGFLHHIPGTGLRARLLEELVRAARPQGVIAVSLWRFASDDAMREKAERSTAEALDRLHLHGELENGDYLLGWNDTSGSYRYCHSFDEQDAEHLISHVASCAELADRFKADGRTGALNEYLVFRKRPLA